jgi:hypothetical protein
MTKQDLHNHIDKCHELIVALLSFAEFCRLHEGGVFLGRDIGVLIRHADEVLKGPKP